MKQALLRFLFLFILVGGGATIVYISLYYEPDLPIYNPSEINIRLVDESKRGVIRDHTVGEFSLTSQMGKEVTPKDFENWAEFIKENKVSLRYIELMQTGDNLDYFKKYHVSSKIFKEYLNKKNWIYQTLGKDAGPSLNYINPEYKGKFGIIAPYSKDFCRSCNRLRITSRGDLRLCLFGNTGISIRHLLQKDDQIDELQDLIMGQMRFKKESHYLELGETGLTKNLSTTGG